MTNRKRICEHRFWYGRGKVDAWTNDPDDRIPPMTMEHNNSHFYYTFHFALPPNTSLNSNYNYHFFYDHFTHNVNKVSYHLHYVIHKISTQQLSHKAFLTYPCLVTAALLQSLHKTGHSWHTIRETRICIRTVHKPLLFHNAQISDISISFNFLLMEPNVVASYRNLFQYNIFVMRHMHCYL